jgi:phosphotransferase system HPr (HPr) family protein
MPELQLTVRVASGLTARSAAAFRAKSADYSGEVEIARQGGSYLPGHDILALVSLDIRAGDVVRVRVDGHCADAKLAELANVLRLEQPPLDLARGGGRRLRLVPPLK